MSRRASVAGTERTTRELKKLFARLGDQEHPRGRVLVAYRNAVRSLRDILRRQTGMAAYFEAQEVLAALRREVEQIARQTLGDAITLGEKQAFTEYTAWGLSGDLGIARNVDVFLGGWLGRVDQQITEALAVIVSEGDPSLIMGDDTRQGLLRPDTVISSGTKWLTTAAILTFSDKLVGPLQQTGERWGKQAIPAIDRRTTDCCLQVAGQVVPFDAKFKLTGTPRFADELDWSPFHWYCRTSIAMVPLAQADDDLTERLRANSQVELGSRAIARQEMEEKLQQLAKLGAKPDGRRRIDDTKEIRKLRREYIKLKRRAGAVSGS